MEDLITKYWPQMVTAFLGAMWLARIDARVKQVADDLAEAQRELVAVKANAAIQDVTLARIGESLSAIKITVDRIYARTDRMDRSDRAA